MPDPRIIDLEQKSYCYLAQNADGTWYIHVPATHVSQDTILDLLSAIENRVQEENQPCE